MAILVAKLTLIKCEQDHGKHTVEKFSYLKKTPLRSCATCIDMVEGLSDWEIALLREDSDFVVSSRLFLASIVRNMAMAASK